MPTKNNFKIAIISLVAVAILSVIITMNLFRAAESEQAQKPISAVSPAVIVKEIKPADAEKAPKTKTQQEDNEIEFEGKIKGPLLQ